MPMPRQKQKLLKDGRDFNKRKVEAEKSLTLFVNFISEIVFPNGIF